MWKQKKVGVLASWEATLVLLDRSWLPLSENPDHYPQKANRSARRCIWRYRFQAWVWTCQILNQVVESQLLFTSLRNEYQKSLSDVKLIQISAFLVYLISQLESESEFEIVIQLKTTENGRFHVYSLWGYQAYQQRYLHIQYRAL